MMILTAKEDWMFVKVEDGTQCVTIIGQTKTKILCAEILVSVVGQAGCFLKVC